MKSSPPRFVAARLAAVLALGIPLAGCDPAPSGPPQAGAPTKEVVPALDIAPVLAAVADGRANASWSFSVSGMHCDDCAKGIRSELLRGPGVVAAEVGLKQRQAVVAVDTNRVAVETLTKLVADSGYRATLIRP